MILLKLANPILRGFVSASLGLHSLQDLFFHWHEFLLVDFISGLWHITLFLYIDFWETLIYNGIYFHLVDNDLIIKQALSKVNHVLPTSVDYASNNLLDDSFEVRTQRRI